MSESEETPVEVTCIREGVYQEALTYGKVYTRLAFDKVREKIKLRGDNGRARWFPAAYFVLGQRDVAKIARIVSIDDIVLTPGSIEVTIELADGQQRWCFFVTPERLGELNSGTDLLNARLILYHVPHMIVVDRLTPHVITLALQHIEHQGEILRCTLALEDSLEM